MLDSTFVHGHKIHSAFNFSNALLTTFLKNKIILSFHLFRVPFTNLTGYFKMKKLDSREIFHVTLEKECSLTRSQGKTDRKSHDSGDYKITLNAH